MTVRADPERDLGLQGHYAGIATRTAAFAIDVLVAMTLFTLGGRVVEYVLSVLFGREFSLSNSQIVSVVALVLWLLAYFAYPIAMSGRTLGMALAGLEVVTREGHDVNAKKAIVRTIFLPVSLILLGIGIATILINRERRALHDLVAGTAVVYSWNARAARLRLLAKRVAHQTPETPKS